MSTYVLMRMLESSPRRYELGMRLLTLGRVERAYDRLADSVREGHKVLDVGTGPGALALRAARRGARVKAIDLSPAMLEVANARLREAGLADRVELAEQGVAELDAEPEACFDVVTAGLCLSELSDDEVRYALEQSLRVLRPGGQLLIADEVVPERPAARLAHALLRAPLALLTWLVTQQSSHAIENLVERVEAAGFEIVARRSDALGSFVELVASKPGRSPA